MKEPKVTRLLAERLTAAREDADLTVDEVLDRCAKLDPTITGSARSSIGYILAGKQGTRPGPYVGIKGGARRLRLLCRVLKVPFPEAFKLGQEDRNSWEEYRRWEEDNLLRQVKPTPARGTSIRRLRPIRTYQRLPKRTRKVPRINVPLDARAVS